MKTLPQLISRTDAVRMQNARYVKIERMKTGHDANGKAFVAGITYSYKVVNAHGKLVPVMHPSKYVTTITFLDNKLHCKVSCSCPDFMYMYEVALHNKDAADIEYSNGALPVEKNPRMIPGVCKHTVALYERILPQLMRAQTQQQRQQPRR